MSGYTVTDDGNGATVTTPDGVKVTIRAPEGRKDFDSLEFIQKHLKWGNHEYGPHFQSDMRPHRDSTHALLHILKALGKLADAIDQMEHHTTALHDVSFALRDDIGKYTADIIICAVQFARRWPLRQDYALSVSARIAARIRDKFPNT